MRAGPDRARAGNHDQVGHRRIWVGHRLHGIHDRRNASYICISIMQYSHVYKLKYNNYTLPSLNLRRPVAPFPFIPSITEPSAPYRVQAVVTLPLGARG